MTEQPPPHREREPEDQPEPMPAWVPVAIGLVLVTLAALAVITGIRYRGDQTLVRMVQPRQRAVRTTAPAPPGEPEPGASLMFPGDSNVPQAREPAPGSSRAEITGGPGGVSAALRLAARRGMRTNITPSDAVVYVNDVAIGQAAQFDSEDEEYDFAAPGSYTVRLIAPGYKERDFIITASDNAKDEVARIEVKLEKQ
jgi:hypothetical protein